MESNNLELWQAFGKTDPKYTKAATTKGGFTSISAYYQIERATERWGVYGDTWGLKDIKVDYSLLETTGLAVMSAVFHCPVSMFEINNAYAVMAVGKGYVDADFMKKLSTNTLTKALSMVGMSNDIFKGQFDDEEYLSMRKAEADLASSKDKEKRLKERFEEIKNEVMESCQTISKLPNQATIDNFVIKIKNNAAKSLSAYNFSPNALDAKIDAIASERLNQINNKDK